MSLTEQEDIGLAMAIQASLEQEPPNTLITTTYKSSRTSLPFPKLGPSLPVDQDPSACTQQGLFNQFHSFWSPLISKYEAPSAICGYIAMSLPLLLAQSQHLPFQALKDQLCNMNNIYPFLDDSMKFIHEWRSQYINTHLKDFQTEKSKQDYKRAWIANYEISDYLISKIPIMKENNFQVLFIRYNEVPEYDTASHEEKTRMSEQFPFGGKKGIKANPECFGPKESMIIVESFLMERKLWRPEEALNDPFIRNWNAVVLDVNGHFLVGVPGRENGKKQIILLNTMENNCLIYYTSALAYDLLE